jgi:hypothetical protein
MSLATVTDACREYAYNVGMHNQDRAWILTDYDTWQANPFYRGLAVRHPEDDTPGGHQAVAPFLTFDMECPF